MTLDEAIKRAEEVAKEEEKAAKEWHENQVRKCELIRFAEMDYTHENECKKCAEEHRQLAEWLKQLKEVKRILDASSYVENGITYSYCYDNDTRVKHLRKVFG